MLATLLAGFFLVPVCSWLPPFYHPIAPSSSVTRVAKSFPGVDTKNEPYDIVLARSRAGQPLAFKNYCPHRGACFDATRIGEDDTVTCKYHSFVYDVKKIGKLISGLGVTPGCSTLPLMNTIEIGGLVWVQPNSTVGAIELPWYPPEEFDSTFRKVSGYTDMKSPLENVIENICDGLHLGT
jgi:phenylpropionate dioxygenase-like ring-hydroxylating dioxygenase large terminal subunit